MATDRITEVFLYSDRMAFFRRLVISVPDIIREEFTKVPISEAVHLKDPAFVVALGVVHFMYHRSSLNSNARSRDFQSRYSKYSRLKIARPYN